MIDLSAVVLSQEMVAQTLQYIRSAASFVSNSEGVCAETPADPVEFDANIQPYPADIARVFPEGQRLDNMVTVFTTTELHIADGVSEVADYVVWNSVRYRVVKKSNWQRQGFFQFWAEGVQDV